jgi:hypothetical protein
LLVFLLDLLEKGVFLVFERCGETLLLGDLARQCIDLVAEFLALTV